MLVNYADTKASENYKLMSQSIIPRPIAWVVTENDGVVNVAPFSYFTALSSNPPTMLICVGHKSDGAPKDTLFNLRKNRKCTLCMVKPEHLELMHLSSKEMPANLSEAELFGVGLEEIIAGYPPMIKGAPVAFVCDLYSEVALGESATIPLIVEIKYHYVDDGCVRDKERLIFDFDPVARVGKSYALLGKAIEPPPIPSL